MKKLSELFNGLFRNVSKEQKTERIDLLKVKLNKVYEQGGEDVYKNILKEITNNITTRDRFRNLWADLLLIDDDITKINNSLFESARVCIKNKKIYKWDKDIIIQHLYDNLNDERFEAVKIAILSENIQFNNKIYDLALTLRIYIQSIIRSFIEFFDDKIDLSIESEYEKMAAAM